VSGRLRHLRAERNADTTHIVTEPVSASEGATVIVTGVAGFIGSNLADSLIARGYRVRGIDDLSSGVLAQVPPGVDFERVDIRSPDLHRHFEGASAVFHLAAKNCIPDCQLEPVETASVASAPVRTTRTSL
jgi:nucleoside-diphosphate-sugar epimerase